MQIADISTWDVSDGCNTVAIATVYLQLEFDFGVTFQYPNSTLFHHFALLKKLPGKDVPTYIASVPCVLVACLPF